jgi:hypothetical protein
LYGNFRLPNSVPRWRNPESASTDPDF